MSKTKVKRIVSQTIHYVIYILIAVIYFFPVYCLLVKSVMPDHQLLQLPSLWPEFFNFEPYKKAFSAEYLQYFGNTAIVCLSNILGLCVTAPLAAYAFAKLQFKGRDLMFGLVLATVLLPGTVTAIPLYSIYLNIGWTGTLLPLCVPIWFGGGAMNIFLIRQFMKGIPDSYCEAAIIDGAGSFQIYTKIIIPMIKPVLGYLAIMTFQGCWNDFQGPLMYVSSEKSSWTLSLALYKNFADLANATNLPNVQMAVGVMMMIPIIILFAAFNKQMVQGVSAVGIKG